MFRVAVLTIAVSWVLLASTPPAMAQFRVFEGPYVDGPIYSTVEHAGSLVVAGHFRKLGTQNITNVAVWDGSSWRGIGPIQQIHEFVYSLCVVDGDLVAGITYQVPVPQESVFEIHSVHRWDGQSWSQLGAPLRESPRALAVHRGELYASVRLAIPARGETPLYRWDESDWRPCNARVGAQVVQVRAMASHQGRLFVGGSFRQELTGAAFPTAVHAYDANGWMIVGDGLQSDQIPLTGSLPEGVQGVHDLRVVNGALYATGNFVQTTPQIAGLAKWDGATWVGLPTIGTGHGLAEFRSKLVPYGVLAHDTGDGSYDYFLGALNGSTWERVQATGPGGSACDPVAVSAVEFDSELVLAREFNSQRYAYGFSPSVPSLTAWNGSRWRSLVPGDSPTDEVYAMLEYEGRLVCGGGFRYAGGQPALAVAAWDGATWAALGTGFEPIHFVRGMYTLGGRGGVWALATVGRDLFAGGHFASEYDENITGVARWDGERWHAAGAGIRDGVVYALVEFDGLLVAGGTFSRAGAQEVSGLASWDGNAWRAFPPGIDFVVDEAPYRRRIMALAVYDGHLYAGGSFETIGGVTTPYFARWNGSQWEDPGLDFFVDPASVYDLEVHQGWLVVAASNQVLAWTRLTPAEEATILVGTVAQGDYSAWVWDLLSDGDHLYATGVFQTVDDVQADDLAIWDGASWSSPGRPGAGEGWSLARHGDDIYVGGRFKRPQDPDFWHMFSFPADGRVPAVSVQLEARPHVDSVELSWELRNGDLVEEVRLDRQRSDGAWRTLFSQTSQRHASREMQGRSSFADETAVPGEHYTYRLVATLVGNEQVSHEVAIELPPLPNTERGCILAAAPNPFNPVITLTVSVVTPGDVYVDVFDVAGRHVRQLHREALPSGAHEVVWRGLDRDGKAVASGVYTVLLRTPDGRDTERITLVK